MQSKSTSLLRRVIFRTVDLLNCLAAVVVIVFIALTLFGRYSFFELAVHFRLQYAIGSIICLILLAVFRRRKLALLLFICAAFNIAQIIPYYFGSPHRISDGETQKLRLMTANVAMRNDNYAAFRQSVESAAPDILVLQEVTADWDRAIQPLRAFISIRKSFLSKAAQGLRFLAVTRSNRRNCSLKNHRCIRRCAPSLISKVRG